MTDLQGLTQETNRIVTASFDVLLQLSRPLNARMCDLPSVLSVALSWLLGSHRVFSLFGLARRLTKSDFRSSSGDAIPRLYMCGWSSRMSNSRDEQSCARLFVSMAVGDWQLHWLPLTWPSNNHPTHRDDDPDLCQSINPYASLGSPTPIQNAL
jgi:hypothetical protein